MALHPQLDDLIQRVLPVVQDFHRKGMFAPHAATIDATGALTGRALTSDGTTQLSVSQSLEHFEDTFTKLARSGEIQGAGIFYHSPGIDARAEGLSLPPASTTDECHTLVALLEHASGDSVYLLIPYTGQPPSVEYGIGKLIEKPSKLFVRSERQDRRPWWKLW